MRSVLSSIIALRTDTTPRTTSRACCRPPSLPSWSPEPGTRLISPVTREPPSFSLVKARMVTRTLTFSFVLCLGAFVSLFASSAPTHDWDALRTVVDAELAQSKIPGAAVAVVADGKLVFAEGFGVANLAQNTAVTPRTRFRIGSLTKMFTAAAILSLATSPDAKLSLQTPIREYVTDLPPRIGDLTLDQLLSHRAGLTDRVSGAPAREGDLFNEPDQIFSYSSLGYSLAGRVASDAADDSFEALLNETVFAPIRMTATSYPPSDIDTIGYRLHKGKPVKTKPLVIDSLRPAGLLYSNLEDLSRFALAFVNGEIDRPVVAELSQPRTEIPGEPRRYGYGTIVGVEGGETVVYHMGDEPGGSAVLKMVPEKRAAVIVLTNMMGRLPRTMETALHEACGMKVIEKTEQKPARLSPSEIDELVGKYENSYGLTIKRENETVTLEEALPWFLRWLVPHREVLRLGDDQYGIIVPDRAEPIKIYLVRSPEGRIEYLFISGRAFKRES